MLLLLLWLFWLSSSKSNKLVTVVSVPAMMLGVPLRALFGWVRDDDVGGWKLTRVDGNSPRRMWWVEHLFLRGAGGGRGMRG